MWRRRAERAARAAAFLAVALLIPAAARATEPEDFQILKKQGLVTKGERWGYWRLTAAGLAAAEAAGASAPKKAPKGEKAAPKRAAKKRKTSAKAPKAKAGKRRKAPAKRKARAKAVAAAAQAAEGQG